jgi:YbbR domain-containing protein
MRIISGIALTLSSIMLAFYLFLGTNNMFGTNPSDAMPYIIASLSATIFSWLIEVKYEAHRDVPETSTKKERTIYGIIGISIILLFAALVVCLPLISV